MYTTINEINNLPFIVGVARDIDNFTLRNNIDRYLAVYNRWNLIGRHPNNLVIFVNMNNININEAKEMQKEIDIHRTSNCIVFSEYEYERYGYTRLLYFGQKLKRYYENKEV